MFPTYSPFATGRHIIFGPERLNVVYLRPHGGLVIVIVGYHKKTEGLISVFSDSSVKYLRASGFRVSKVIKYSRAQGF